MMPDTEHDTISVTLKLAPEAYEFFAKKARKAGVGLESFLNSTLASALGCKAGDSMSPSSYKASHKAGSSEKCC